MPKLPYFTVNKALKGVFYIYHSEFRVMCHEDALAASCPTQIKPPKKTLKKNLKKTPEVY